MRASEGARQAQAVFSKELPPEKLILATGIPRLDLLAADRSLRELDRFLFGLGKKKRLEKLLDRLGENYDGIILDCLPGLTETSEQVLRAADVIVVPVIPSPLSQRALDEVVDYLDRKAMRSGAILPIFNMVDRRRSMHLDALAAKPRWPAIPMASAIEAMSARRQAVGEYAGRSAAGEALAVLWTGIERRLSRTPKAG